MVDISARGALRFNTYGFFLHKSLQGTHASSAQTYVMQTITLEAFWAHFIELAVAAGVFFAHVAPVFVTGDLCQNKSAANISGET